MGWLPGRPDLELFALAGAMPNEADFDPDNSDYHFR